MNSVKTYQKVNCDEDISFRISKMEDIYTERNGEPDEPHRHNYYTVLVVKHSDGVHKIDFNSYLFSKKQVFFVAPGQVHQVIEVEKPKGFALLFSNQFLVENSIPISFIESLHLFQNYGQSPPLLPDDNKFNTIEQFAQQIFEVFNSDANMKYLSIGALLKLLLIECNNICSVNPIETNIDTSGDILIRAFKKLVEEHYKTKHSTSFYADELHITSDHLNRTIKSRIGKTAKDYIQARIITEAKRLLYFTELTTKEIGYELGFNEPANFSAFFKKNTNQSPSNFKKSETKS